MDNIALRKCPSRSSVVWMNFGFYPHFNWKWCHWSHLQFANNNACWQYSFPPSSQLFTSWWWESQSWVFVKDASICLAEFFTRFQILEISLSGTLTATVIRLCVHLSMLKVCKRFVDIAILAWARADLSPVCWEGGEHKWKHEFPDWLIQYRHLPLPRKCKAGAIWKLQTAVNCFPLACPPQTNAMWQRLLSD